MLVDQVNPDKRVPHVILFYFNFILFIFYLITYKWDPCVIGWFRYLKYLAKSANFRENYPLATFGDIRFGVPPIRRVSALYESPSVSGDLESGMDGIFTIVHLLN